ncbi:unnamed protein product [Brachionus calyciflorus]|uniref:Amino acid transporter transmembrane domain-containing protein n=1 Tax=Brachionus calyciflorus TaxID=104777 RepID=A0A813M231_9BILA|nr:unnamed protein product [Brachionus calyciflorus]
MPSSSSGPESGQYGLAMGFIYIFNLIVGSGALTMPKAFANSGILLSSILLIFLNLMSFITATFMFEAMSIMNAIKNFRKFNETLGYSNPVCEPETTDNPKRKDFDSNAIDEGVDEIASEDRYAYDAQNEIIYKIGTDNIVTNENEEQNGSQYSDIEKKQADNLFAIRNKYEMGEMAGAFFNKTGQFFFYVAMILYLYGDLAIYDAAVPKSLRDTTCTYKSSDENQTLSESDLCWSSVPSINRMNAYRLYVLAFNFTIGILVFYNVEKTKLLQLATTIMRWLAFITMITLATIKIIDNTEKSSVPRPALIDIPKVPNFFGVCIYAFMCHHSLPGIITPMKNKQNYKYIFVGVYLCVLFFYLLLSFTGVFAFGDSLEDFYTLNFLPNNQDKNKQSLFLTVIDYYLSLFPVFTISASFPIIGITLRNNLKSLFHFISQTEPTQGNNKSYFTSIGLPLITLVPPLLISLITHDLQLLVGITGSYAGVAIQYIIPSCLVYFGRKEAIRVFRQNFQYRNSFSSPFTINSIDTVRYSPFSSEFNNLYDYADAESYSVNLFKNLFEHLNSIKREQNNCKNIPLPKTILKKKYFNPSYELMQYKYWYPPRDHQFILVWSQFESYRNSLFLSYMLQNDNAHFPPGWLYLYLTAAAQLHSMQTIGYNSHKIIKSIKIPFESNEVFKVNWWNHGTFQKFEKPFAIYASQPNPSNPKLIRVVDFGAGDYTNDYTGHGFLPVYLYDRRKHLLNNTFEYTGNWKKPSLNPQFQQLSNDRNKLAQNVASNQQQDLENFYKQMQNNQPKNPFMYEQNNLNSLNNLENSNNRAKRPEAESLDDFSSYVLVKKNKIPIYDWDPIVDHGRTNLENKPNRNSPYNFNQWYVETIADNIVQENTQTANENPFDYRTLSYIDSYRYAKVWWNNETDFKENIQEYVFRIKPEERFYRFNGVKQETSTSWTSPYFWCIDPTHWLVTVKSPIWADNDHIYKNKIFYSPDQNRFVGLSEIVLNYEELDVNQCPGDRQLNAFSSTSLCDSTSECIPLPLFGLKPGGYQCQCSSGYSFPFNFQGPFKGTELSSGNFNYPLCEKSEGLVQYPNWISRNFVENQISNVAYSSFDPNFNLNLKKRNLDSINKKESRKKRFIDRRNNFEKLRDSIFIDQDILNRKCSSLSFQDTIFLNEDDERFSLNLRNHANQVFKPQMAQALRIAHVLSAYIQLHSPFSSSSINTQNDLGYQKNIDNLKPDPQLDESIIIGEIMSTLISNYPIQEVNVFFNGTEYERQKFFSSQNTLSFGLSAIRSDIELILNRTNDNSHLRKSWYLDSIRKFMYSSETKYAGPYFNGDEQNFYASSGPFENDLFGDGFKFDRYGIEMNIRKTFDGLSGNVELSPKFYDAASSGVWYGPYFDCQKRYLKTKTSLRMLYSVPIVTSMNKLPIGFVSVVVGSDLKWWKINPCESSKERNMFQNLHRCDQETTICQEQHVPEFENGFYLSSYKCMCKANYEFPFLDYGSSYFEGATVEREYDKKMKGMPNIYDRLRSPQICLNGPCLFSTKLNSKSDDFNAKVTEKKSKEYIGPKDFRIQSYLLRKKLTSEQEAFLLEDNSKQFSRENSFFEKNASSVDFYNYPKNEKLHNKHEYYMRAGFHSGIDLRRFENLIKKEEKEKMKLAKIELKNNQKLLKQQEKAEKKAEKLAEKIAKKKAKTNSAIINENTKHNLETDLSKNDKKQEETEVSPNEFTLNDEAKQIVEQNLIKFSKKKSTPQKEDPFVTETKQRLEILRNFFLKQDLDDRSSKISRYVKFLNRYKLNENFLVNSINQLPFLPTDLVLQNKSMYTTKEISLTQMKLFESNQEILNDNYMPSVSNVIDLAYPLSENLLKWKIEKAQVLGLEGFKLYSDQIRKDGEKFHKYIEDRLLNKPTVLYDQNLEGLDKIFKDIDQVLLTESPVKHSNLFYQGRIDCLAYYKGELCLVDWKCSEKNKPTMKDLYDLPVQISAYIGAYLNDPRYESLKKGHKLKKGLLVNYNKQDGEVNVHLINYQLAEFYWYKWLSYLKEFWVQIKKNDL